MEEEFEIKDQPFPDASPELIDKGPPEDAQAFGLSNRTIIVVGVFIAGRCCGPGAWLRAITDRGGKEDAAVPLRAARRRKANQNGADDQPDGLECGAFCVRAWRWLVGARRVHDALLELHYGVDSPQWNRGLVSDMSQKRAGLVIFDGAPGTGKTYYLRHLMETLKESHRFYFLPPSYIDFLTRPDFIGFWADQRRTYSDCNFVVIIEDAEGALMSRGGDNRNQVSSLLNLSAGMLADFLRLQIICTVNCAATSIDPALLRPGRLICHKHFPKLDYASAARLADSLGKNLPQSRDYSLAEIFAESVPNQPVKHSLGFN